MSDEQKHPVNVRSIHDAVCANCKYCLHHLDAGWKHKAVHWECVLSNEFKGVIVHSGDIVYNASSMLCDTWELKT